MIQSTIFLSAAVLGSRHCPRPVRPLQEEERGRADDVAGLRGALCQRRHGDGALEQGSKGVAVT